MKFVLNALQQLHCGSFSSFIAGSFSSFIAGSFSSRKSSYLKASLTIPGVINIPFRAAVVEGVFVRRCKRCTGFQPFDQVGV